MRGARRQLRRGLLMYVPSVLWRRYVVDALQYCFLALFDQQQFTQSIVPARSTSSRLTSWGRRVADTLVTRTRRTMSQATDLGG